MLFLQPRWGAKSVGEEELEEPINSLEEEKDHDGVWRRYVNNQLAAYQNFFRTDALIFLAVPDMSSVLNWRWQQEAELKQGSQCMSKDEVQEFIMHFERISLRLLSQMPGEANLTLFLAQDHHISRAELRK